MISSALAYGIYHLVEPTYRATGMVKVESNQPDLFGPSMELSGRESQSTYLLTEIETMKSNPVLDLALTRNAPSIADHAFLRESKDPKSDLRRRLAFDVVPNTHWIRVACDSAAPDEARDIVNAVIGAYEETMVSESLGTPTATKTMARKKLVTKIAQGFLDYKKALEDKIKATRETLRKLARKDEALATRIDHKSKGEEGPTRTPGYREWNSHVNEIEASFLRDDLERYYLMFDQVNRKLEQLEFTRDKAGIQLERIVEAELPKVPFSDERHQVHVNRTRRGSHFAPGTVPGHWWLKAGTGQGIEAGATIPDLWRSSQKKASPGTMWEPMRVSLTSDRSTAEPSSRDTKPN